MMMTVIRKDQVLLRELARRLAGIGQPWLKPGDEPMADLIRERVAEDKAHAHAAWATFSS